MPNEKPQRTGRPPAGRRNGRLDGNGRSLLRVAYQGEPGCNSHVACLSAFAEERGRLRALPHLSHLLSGEHARLQPVSNATFEDALASVLAGDAHYAMIPIENSVAGRVADIHHLLPLSGLHIVGEHFERVRHQLMARPGTPLKRLRKVLSHTQALGQCRATIRKLGLEPVPEADTAGSARLVAEKGDETLAAIAPALAAEVYGLEIVLRDIEDIAHNTTRFVLLARDPHPVAPKDEPVITTFVFRVRNIPGALYKALGGFATNGVNMTKLESYQLEGTFAATMFYADAEGHPEAANVARALEELRFFSTELRILGCYKASPYRRDLAKQSALAKLAR
ncbi:MAG TPA: prephenate dehydratase [Hyphomicrobiaceae bacterium]|nr:prephenate dehydratase [Hyphomicrobiaceae bacterium]